MPGQGYDCANFGETRKRDVSTVTCYKVSVLDGFNARFLLFQCGEMGHYANRCSKGRLAFLSSKTNYNNQRVSPCFLNKLLPQYPVVYGGCTHVTKQSSGQASSDNCGYLFFGRVTNFLLIACMLKKQYAADSHLVRRVSMAQIQRQRQSQKRLANSKNVHACIDV